MAFLYHFLRSLHILFFITLLQNEITEHQIACRHYNTRALFSNENGKNYNEWVFRNAIKEIFSNKIIDTWRSMKKGLCFYVRAVLLHLIYWGVGINLFRVDLQHINIDLKSIAKTFMASIIYFFTRWWYDDDTRWWYDICFQVSSMLYYSIFIVSDLYPLW